MLRQIFRQRAAYNVVNLPIASTQDDPSSSQGPYADYWHHYHYAQYQPVYGTPYTPLGYFATYNRYLQTMPQQEFREDVGLEAWNRAKWWEDRGLSSRAAAQILRKRLETYGPQRERSLVEVIARVRSPKDAETALKAAELFRRYRSAREQHAPFKLSTAKMIIKMALQVNAPEVAVQVLERKDELGFVFGSLRAYRQAITYFSTQRDLKNVIRVFNLAKSQGHQPNRDLAFCIVRACLDCDRSDLAYSYAVEFQENGLQISEGQANLVEAAAGKKLPPFMGAVNGDTGSVASSEAGDTEPSTPTASSSKGPVSPTGPLDVNTLQEASSSGSQDARVAEEGAPVVTVSAIEEPEVAADPSKVAGAVGVVVEEAPQLPADGAAGVAAAVAAEAVAESAPNEPATAVSPSGVPSTVPAKAAEGASGAADASRLSETIEPEDEAPEVPLRRAYSV